MFFGSLFDFFLIYICNLGVNQTLLAVRAIIVVLAIGLSPVVICAIATTEEQH